MKKSKQEAYQQLRSDIMNLKLEPGRSISETEIGTLFNISRTPVREILQKLTEENLIEIYPQIGSFISKIDLKIVDDAVFLRELCEKEMIRFSMQRSDKTVLIRDLKKNIAFQQINYNYQEDFYEFFQLDNTFHEIIYAFNERDNIWKNIGKLTTHYDRLRLLDAADRNHQKRTIEEHIKIIQIIEDAREDCIEQTVLRHLEKYKSIIDRLKEKYPTYFK
ncbi:MAG: GntR family transcriptional regulator [Treponema sp.]